MTSGIENTTANAPSPPEPSTGGAKPAVGRRPMLSMRLIVTTVAVFLITGAVFGASLVAERNTRRALTREIESRLVLEAHNLALVGSDALLTEFPELVLHPLLKEMQANQPELALAVVTDHEGRVQGHADARLLGTAFDPPSGLQPLVDAPDPTDGVSLLGNGDMLVAVAPITHSGTQVIGTVQVGLRWEYIDGIIGAARRQQLTVFGLVLVVGVVATLILMTRLLRPIGVLRRGLERIGSGDLDTPLRMSNRTELGALADTVNTMAAELKSAQAEMVEKERLAHELDLAREIQTSLLPTEGRTAGPFTIEGFHRAAAEVGGDYYDILDLPNGRIGIAVADVAGKGLAGCLVMSMLSALLRALRDGSRSPSELLILLDERLGESLRRGSFVTMFYGILDPASGRLVYGSAGHSPLLVFRGATGTVERIGTRGIPLGAIRGGAIARTLEDAVIDLTAGDMLVQYTDGVNEAFDAAGNEQFGFDRLEALLAGLGPGGASNTLDGVRNALDTWRRNGPRSDDETLLVIHRSEAAAAPATIGPREEDALPGDPLELLAVARRRGVELSLPSTFEDPEKLRGWLEGLCGERMQTQEVDLVYTALYETCANIAEHGYGSRSGEGIRIWWVCDSATNKLSRTCDVPCAPIIDRPEGGRFLVQDQGRPFSADNWTETDFSDRRVWSRGRGFGLDIIHKTMEDVSYHPATAEGNLTILHYRFRSPSVMERENKRA